MTNRNINTVIEGVALPFPAEAGLISLTSPTCRLHPDAMPAFTDLCAAAEAEGFAIAVASSFRSVERQLLIWNDKVAGIRPVLDSLERPLDLSRMTDYEKVIAILRWSALPGCSRHHWGTDLDIYDAAAVASDYRVQLTAAECADEGPFTTFHQWLDQRIATGNAFGFYRPYGCDRGGVAPEPWHISYAPVADQIAAALNEKTLRELVAVLPLALRETVLEYFTEIYARFFVVPGVGEARNV